MTKHLFSTALGLSLALTTLAGCGNTSLLSATTGTDAASLQAAANGKGGHGRGGDMRKGGKPGGPASYFADLDLTADQQAQIQAIQEKYRPAKPTADASAKPEAPGAKLQAILVAETLDVDALKAALAEKPAAPPADKADHRVAELTEIRAVLTEAQRATIVEKLNAAPAPTSKPDFAAHRAAEIAFWQTGDATGLTADKPAAVAPPAFPVDAFVAFASSLSAEQRQQVFAKGGFAIGFGPGGHEGRHGGPGGEGGRGGHGDFGGQPPLAPADQAAAE